MILKRVLVLFEANLKNWSPDKTADISRRARQDYNREILPEVQGRGHSHSQRLRSESQHVKYGTKTRGIRLGRELFNWADRSCSIRVRIVYESWNRFVVPSIKSSVQKTSSRTQRLLAPARFCKKDENLFCFFLWHCFALAFSLKALLHFKVFKMVAQGTSPL